MKEAIGGMYTFQALFIFIVLVCGILLFSFNYVKSFKVKNDLINVIEQYEGFSEDAASKANLVMRQYEYSFAVDDPYVNYCRNHFDDAYVLEYGGRSYVFCVSCNLVDAEGGTTSTAKYKGARYTVGTFVNVEIPLLRNLFEATGSFLTVTGSTDLIYSSGNNSELCNAAKVD